MTNLSDYFQTVGEAGSSYVPASMEFDGNLDYYTVSNQAFGSSNKITVICRIKCSITAGSDAVYMISGGNGGNICFSLYIHEDSHAEAGKIRFAVGAPGILCSIYSTIRLDDGEWHTILVSYDAVAGTAVMLVDHNDVDDSGHGGRVLTTGTIYNNGSCEYRLGIAWWDSPSAASSYTGIAGFTAVVGAYLTDSSPFFDTNLNPIALDESGWTEFTEQPKIWNEHGDWRNNLGSMSNASDAGNVHVAPAERPV